MDNEIIKKAEAIINKNTVNGGTVHDHHCVLTLIDSFGYPTSSVITPSKSDGINWITFVAGFGSNKAQRIAKCGRASVCFSSPAYSVGLVGDIEIITDPEVKKEMWYKGCEQHFSGYDDPNYCVLKFTTIRYNLFADWQEAQGGLK